MKSDRDRCIALAGMFQAAALVSNIAHHGDTDQDATKASIYSLFQIDAQSVATVYGGLNGITVGLQELVSQLMRTRKQNTETIRYVITLMHLERKLAKQPTMLKKISEGIQLATERLDHFPMLHQNILGQLADLYAQTLSTMQPRILVQGDQMHLQNRDNINSIRSLLLAGIRSAMLWRQCGGQRLQVILTRKRIAKTAEQILYEIDSATA